MSTFSSARRRSRPPPPPSAPATPPESSCHAARGKVAATEGFRYRFVTGRLDRSALRAEEITILAPDTHPPESVESALAAAAQWWPLQMARELDDAILNLRTNYLDYGVWVR